MYPHLDNLKSLSREKRLAFIASCSERLLPNYQLFADAVDWGDPELLFTALEFIWKHIAGEIKDQSTLTELLKGCYKVIPDTDAFDSVYASLAMDAGSVIVYGLQACLDAERKYAVFAGNIALRSVDTYLYLVNAPVRGFKNLEARRDFDAWLQDAPLLQAEVAKQQRDIDLLTLQKRLSKAFLATFRQSATETGILLARRGVILP